MFLIITKLSLICVLLFSVAGHLGRFHKYAELASHFRVQYLLGSSACLITFCLFQEWGWTLIAAVGALINLAEIAPWYLYPKNLAGNRTDRRRLKLVLANVNFENTAHGAFIAFAQRQAPDVLVVQELNHPWCESLRALRSLYPFSEVLPKGGGSGMALYSRFPFERLKIVLPEGDARPGILVKLKIGGGAVSVLSLHPRAPNQKGHFELRNGMLASAADYLRNLPPPKICVGDLNITPWSPYYRSFAKETGLVNVRKGFGLLPSWPTILFFRWLMIPLDHCLVSDDIKVIQAQTGERFGSDHLPLIVEIELEAE